MIRTPQQERIYRLASKLPGRWPWRVAPWLYRRTHAQEAQSTEAAVLALFRQHFPDASDATVREWARLHVNLVAYELMDAIALRRVGCQGDVRLKVEGMDKLQRGLKAGRGAIIILTHFDRILTGPIAVAQSGVPVSSLTMEIDENNELSSLEKAYFHRKISTFDDMTGGISVKRNRSIKKIYESLGRGDTWTILADALHPEAKNKRAHPFLGKTLYLATGIERIAAHTDSALLHVTSFTEPDGTVRIRIRDLEGTPEQAVDQVIQQLERDVRERPWAWWNWGLLDALTTPPGG